MSSVLGNCLSVFSVAVTASAAEGPVRNRFISCCSGGGGVSEPVTGLWEGPSFVPQCGRGCHGKEAHKAHDLSEIQF